MDNQKNRPGFLPADIVRFVSPQVLQRASQYVQEKRVGKWILEGSAWKCRVEGRDIYEVILFSRDGKINGWDCSCPFEQEAICKHVAAAVLCFPGVTKE
ncbi:MAG: hypothetical protein GYB31_05860 [Bacteroidetes bacterium]|nr:hypothetical protein [Bacteroidota bacterium]